MPFYERQPYISPLHQIVAEVLRGEILIPRFQRPGTEWVPTQRGDLLDSLYRGFPIGTILLWSTNSPIKTKDVIGGFRIRKASSRDGQRLLLDGHQRLSTLVQILGPGLVHDLQLAKMESVVDDTDEASQNEVWVFELNPAKNEKNDAPPKSRDRFVLLKTGQSPTPTQLPLSHALNRTALNRWVREQGDKLTEPQVTEVDALRDRLREYNIPVAVLAVDSLEDATESFKRINSSGTPMTDFNMVAALAYRNGFDPQELFEQHRSELLEPIGWQDLPDMDVLRVCAALAQQHPAKMEVDKLSQQLAKQDGLIQRAFQAMADAARLVGELCGITGPEVLPYSWQLITLAVCLGSDFFDERSEPRAREAIRRWLWLTTYGEAFAGVNSAIYDRSLTALREMIHGGTFQAMERDLTKNVRPVLNFDFRAARSKAVALAMARHEDGGDLSGTAHRQLAIGADAIGVLQPSGKRSDWWNRVILTTDSVNSYRTALRSRTAQDSKPEEDELLAKIGIARDAQGGLADLLTARRKAIEADEREFVTKLGLEWASAV